MNVGWPWTVMATVHFKCPIVINTFYSPLSSSQSGNKQNNEFSPIAFWLCELVLSRFSSPYQLTCKLSTHKTPKK